MIRFTKKDSLTNVASSVSFSTLNRVVGLACVGLFAFALIATPYASFADGLQGVTPGSSANTTGLGTQVSTTTQNESQEQRDTQLGSPNTTEEDPILNELNQLEQEVPQTMSPSESTLRDLDNVNSRPVTDQPPAEIFESIVTARRDPSHLGDFNLEAAQPGKAYLVLYDGIHSVIVYSDPDASEGEQRFYMVHLVAFAPDVNPPTIEVRLVSPSSKDKRLVASVDVTPAQLKAFDELARGLERMTQERTFTWHPYEEIYDQVISSPMDLGDTAFQNCNATSAQLWYDLIHVQD